MGTQHERERDRRSFQDLARLAAPASSSKALAPQPSARSLDGSATKDDSGLIDLRALSSDASERAAIDRPSVTPLTSAPPPPLSTQAISQPFPSVPSVPSPPSVASVRSVAAAESAIAIPPAPALPTLTSPQNPQKTGKGRVVLILGALAVAAGAVVAVRALQHPAPAPVVVAVPVETAKVAAAPVAPQPAAVETAKAAPAPVETAAPVAVTDAPAANAPVAANAKKASASPAKSSARAAGGGKDTTEKADDGIPAGLQAAMAANAGAPAPPPVTAKDLPPSTTGESGGLGDAIKSSVGGGSASTPATTPAAAPVAAAGSVPQRPSQGAVTGAIGAVLPAARACLGPDDPVSRARVVFGSGGSVESITVTGYAAGKPAEACIKGALGKAKVAPFAEATFAANVTVRP